MTVAAMTCALAGNTGRALEVSRLLLGFSISVLGAVVRTLAPALNEQSQNALVPSAVLLKLGFALVLGKIGRWHWSVCIEKCEC